VDVETFLLDRDTLEHILVHAANYIMEKFEGDFSAYTRLRAMESGVITPKPQEIVKP